MEREKKWNVLKEGDKPWPTVLAAPGDIPEF